MMNKNLVPNFHCIVNNQPSYNKPPNKSGRSRAVRYYRVWLYLTQNQIATTISLKCLKLFVFSLYCSKTKPILTYFHRGKFHFKHEKHFSVNLLKSPTNLLDRCWHGNRFDTTDHFPYLILSFFHLTKQGVNFTNIL